MDEYRDLILTVLIAVGAGLIVGGIIVTGRALASRYIRGNLDTIVKGLAVAGFGVFCLVMAIYYPHYLGLAHPPEVEHLVEIADSVNDHYVKDIYDCSDMAVAFWEKATAEGYRVRIAIGNIDRDITSVDEANHAWCLVWVEEGEGVKKPGWLAIEVTRAFPAYEDDNALYYQGFFYDSPSELWKDFPSP